ncbi:hypothetical protein DNTS_017074 [Danionella cerebrum]|uniref:G-protein coupled receptors family 1 profile domain-containing protein n=1 Tax=Danionella cerebrum TaxID=2873325 RepID=A0A553MUR7_9TELE|nr:hypothetical protein DNTS_017074 [Danionella translucida]
MNTSGGSPDEDEQITILSWIYVSSLSLSLMGSSSVLVVSIVKRKHLNEQVKPLAQLALADFLASLVLMCTVVINFTNNIWRYNPKLCNNGLPLSLAFYCISFLLIIIYAFESAHAFQGWRKHTEQEAYEQHLSRRRRRFCLIYITAWITPIIGYLIYVNTIKIKPATVSEGYEKVDFSLLSSSNRGPTARFCESCILFLRHTNDSCTTVDLPHSEFIRGFTLCSVLIVIVSCSVVYCKLQSCYSYYENTRMFTITQRHPSGIWSSARYMILVIFLCWTPALLLISFSFAQAKIAHLFPLYIIQAISVSLQGFLNSIVYAWRRQNFRKAILGERLPLMAYSNKAFFEQSLSEPA